MIISNQNHSNNGVVEKWCYNNDPNNCHIYGAFYQWNEAMQYISTPGAHGICPPDFHIPTSAEFAELATTVGNDGNALKEIGQGSGAGVGTNTSGFSALLAGHRDWDGPDFYNLGMQTIFWSSSTYSNGRPMAIELMYNNNIIRFMPSSTAFTYGFSVRCIKN